MFMNKPKHIIFLIHGIGGNKSHFGYMSKALSRTLNHKNPAVKHIIRSIKYDTGNNQKTPYDFAQDISTLINRSTDSPGFKSKDKISLIMHSQGGLVGAIWMFQSLMATAGYSTPRTIERLDSFITLGSPFWGAKTAQWGSEIKRLTDRLGVNVPLPFGSKELEQMSFGSDMIFDFRMAMMDIAYKPYIDYLRNNVRFLNIVGVADLLNPLGIFISGTEKYEDDGAVPLSSARFNFIYSQSIVDDYQEMDKVKINNVREVNMAPYVVVNAMHRSPLPELDNFAGIAQIPKKCINYGHCTHPTFPYLWNHILGNKIDQLDARLGDFKTFLVDINLRITADKNYSHDDIRIDFQTLDGLPLKESNIEISKFYEIYARGRKMSEKHTNHCRFYFTGSIKKTLESRKESVLIKFSGKNLKTRLVEIMLKETYSSFIDINLVEKEKAHD